jgi:hypothetical protein
MWARDILIIDGVCHPGGMVQQFRCHSPAIPIPSTSNAVLVQIQGKDRFGKLKAISLVQCYRMEIQGDQAALKLGMPHNILSSREIASLRAFLKREYCEAYARAETQSTLALCKIMV